ncbi:FabD/lysophospholipase-like protein, partial [Atractiella rhizophila]
MWAAPNIASSDIDRDTEEADKPDRFSSEPIKQSATESTTITTVVPRVTQPTVSPSKQSKPLPATSNCIGDGMIDPDLHKRLVDIKKVNTKGLRILSIDNGGVCAFSCLYMLEAIMEQVADLLPGKPDPGTLRPCQFFDLICGTSTGGWIALLLGRLGMTVRECMDAFNEIVRGVFREKSLCTGSSPAYSDKALEEVFERIVRDYITPSESSIFTSLERTALPMTDPNFEERCRTFVIATYEANSVVPLEMRTYSVPSAGGSAAKCSVVDAAKATSAEPAFFPPVTLDKTLYVLVGNNNPSFFAAKEAKRIWGVGIEVICFLSLGVGIRPAVKLGSKPSEDEDAFKKIVEDCSRVDKEMKNEMQGRGIGHCYHRFNVDTMVGVEWDEFGRMKDVVGQTKAYLGGMGYETKAVAESIILAAHPHRVAVHEKEPLPPRGLCYGRTKEVEEVRTAVLRGHHVAIMGLAGNGKSTVALSVLHDECVKPAFIVREGDFLVERRFWVRCDAFTSFAGLENHLCCRVFALSRQFGITDLMAVAEFFQNNKCLLILDNFETPANSDSVRVQHFFQALVGEPGVGSILVLAMRGYHAPRIDVKSAAFVRVVVDTLKEDKAAATDTFCHFYEGGRDP